MALVVLIIWQMESSCGKNMNHPDKASRGHLGIKQCVVDDVNKRYGTKYKWSDCDDKILSFEIAEKYINYYADKWDIVDDVFLLWRCGPTGMKRPTAKQIKYRDNASVKYHALIAGDTTWETR